MGLTGMGDKCTYRIGGGWGRHVEWMDEGEFDRKDFNVDTFRVHGHMPSVPRVGDLLVGEFKRSVITFEFVGVRVPADPGDQFFGEVRAVSQVMK